MFSEKNPSRKPDRDDFDFDTLLCNLPDHCVDRCDGELHEAVKAAGCDIGVRQLINQWNCWGWQVGSFLRRPSSIIAAMSGCGVTASRNRKTSNGGRVREL